MHNAHVTEWNDRIVSHFIFVRGTSGKWNSWNRICTHICVQLRWRIFPFALIPSVRQSLSAYVSSQWMWTVFPGSQVLTQASVCAWRIFPQPFIDNNHTQTHTYTQPVSLSLSRFPFLSWVNVSCMQTGWGLDTKHSGKERTLWMEWQPA